MSRETTLKYSDLALATVLLVAPISATAQQTSTDGGAGGEAATAEESAAEQVVIHREPLQIVDSQRFRVVLKLEPIRVAKVSAAVAGTVAAVLVKPGEKAGAQAEALRLDDAEQQLLLNRATNQQRVAQLELDHARKQDAALVEIAEARLQVATADLELAKLALEKLRVRVPFASEVMHIHVAPGQYVNAGDPLVTVADMTQLKVELPVDRTGISVGQSLPLIVSDKKTTASVNQLLPLPTKLDPLRELVNTVASAVAVIENSKQEFFAGETVHSPLVPYNPLVEISTAAVSNVAGGDRKVQVVRDSVVRDVIIQPLGQAAENRVLVSGEFTIGDELIVSSSAELPDGTQIRLGAPEETSTRAARASGTSRPKPKPKTSRGRF